MPLHCTAFTWSRRQEWNSSGSPTVHSWQREIRSSVMPSFSDLNGQPPSGNAWLLRDVLREEWGFDGFVISDWSSVTQLVVHGVAEDDVDAACRAALAGVTMDMVSGAYASHLEGLVE